MPRRPPRVLAAASAVLLAAVVGLWVRSHLVVDDLAFGSGQSIWNVRLIRGRINVSNLHGLYARFTEIAAERDAWLRRQRAAGTVDWDTMPALPRVKGPPREWRLLGFAYERETGGIPDLTRVVVPYWAVAALAASPLAWAVVARRPRRRPPGHCQSCGYDLTANASGRCPECGSIAEQPGSPSN